MKASSVVDLVMGLVLGTIALLIVTSSAPVGVRCSAALALVLGGLFLIGRVMGQRPGAGGIGYWTSSRPAQLRREDYVALPRTAPRGYCWACGQRLRKGSTICLACGAAQLKPRVPVVDSSPADEPGPPPTGRWHPYDTFPSTTP